MVVDGKATDEILRAIDDKYRGSEPPAIRGQMKGSG